MTDCTMNSEFNVRKSPAAIAFISGSRSYPGISGAARFYEVSRGVMVVTEVHGLPVSEDQCGARVFGYHIHSGGSCTGNMNDPFADTMTHYNPHGCPHPSHAGDMPPLFGNDGYAFSAFVTDRFSVSEIVGKTVVIHLNPDDFTTQPSGNSGTKIACGEIKEIPR